MTRNPEVAARWLRQLTPRQREAVGLYAWHGSWKAVAAHLGISRESANSHGAKACAALGLRSGAQLATLVGLAGGDFLKEAKE